ncbi:glycosyl hydrolase [uncultured Draconibacterium sp.]|uniref:glycoside hydrolase family 26 protein n=1 Tax=uncultured Draconibacterium sp. TaxID=1573823 RepID=UPI0029C02980|nr:glycosyl hydrolase [uncultured Draconibacterium sp.]
MRLVILMAFAASLFACGNKPLPSDVKATKETVKLYQNLHKLKAKGMMYGHQDALAYGKNWYGEEGRSDVKDVCGDYPAVYGWEIGHLELGDEYSLDSVYFDDIKKWIKTVYERGGINTISWHLRNPLTGGSSWDTSSKAVVKSILPNGEKHEFFKTYLDELAEFLLDLKTDDGIYIPVMFRPFHEHTGSWFWWGRDLCSVEDYKALWHFTVDYLQNEKGIHHILYVYSTDRFETKDQYLERYPSDDIVDVLGFDLYDRDKDYPRLLDYCAKTVTQLAAEKGKIAVVSETGGPLATNTEWWTQVLDILKPYELAYVLTWRNPFDSADHGNYGPSKGSPDSENFIQFYNDSETIFQKELTPKKIYD